jgi:DNA polymerase-4/DNA polymerase V
MHEIRRVCPDVVIASSDYTAYSLYARRMYAIVRKYTHLVEEYSIDECFADITDLEESRGMSYEEIGQTIKAHLEESLGLTFGVGLAPTKTLAKVASKHHKPAGFTAIPLEKIPEFLGKTEVYDIWGLGGASGTRLRSLGVTSALEYIEKSEGWLRDHAFVKPQRDTWNELRGIAVLPLTLHAHGDIGSIMTTRTFRPASMEREYIFSQLSKNVEMACAKARRHHVKAHALSFFLKTQEFTYHGVQIDLPVALATPSEILEYIHARFDEVYATDILYRASGITLRSLVSDTHVTPDLFGEYAEISGKNAFSALDSLNKKYGRNTVFLGSSMRALTVSGTKEVGRSFLHAGMRDKKSLDIPYLGVVR